MSIKTLVELQKKQEESGSTSKKNLTALVLTFVLTIILTGGSAARFAENLFQSIILAICNTFKLQISETISHYLFVMCAFLGLLLVMDLLLASIRSINKMILHRLYLIEFRKELNKSMSEKGSDAEFLELAVNFTHYIGFGESYFKNDKYSIQRKITADSFSPWVLPFFTIGGALWGLACYVEPHFTISNLLLTQVLYLSILGKIGFFKALNFDSHTLGVVITDIETKYSKMFNADNAVSDSDKLALDHRKSLLDETAIQLNTDSTEESNSLVFNVATKVIKSSELLTKIADNGWVAISTAICYVALIMIGLGYLVTCISHSYAVYPLKLEPAILAKVEKTISAYDQEHCKSLDKENRVYCIFSNIANDEDVPYYTYYKDEKLSYDVPLIDRADGQGKCSQAAGYVLIEYPVFSSMERSKRRIDEVLVKHACVHPELYPVLMSKQLLSYK